MLEFSLFFYLTIFLSRYISRAKVSLSKIQNIEKVGGWQENSGFSTLFEPSSIKTD
jgi:hypothetical protein